MIISVSGLFAIIMTLAIIVLTPIIVGYYNEMHKRKDMLKKVAFVKDVEKT